MESIVKYRQVIAFFIGYYFLYLAFVISVDLYTYGHPPFEGSLFGEISGYKPDFYALRFDFLMSPFVFILKFGYTAAFIYGTFLFFQTGVSFVQVFSSVLIGNFTYYIGQAINFFRFSSEGAYFKYGDLKVYGEFFSPIQLISQSDLNPVFAFYLNDLNFFTLFYLLIASIVIWKNAKNINWHLSLIYVVVGYYVGQLTITSILLILGALK